MLDLTGEIAVIPGLINTTLTRHEDRYAQAMAEAGQTAVTGGDSAHVGS